MADPTSWSQAESPVKVSGLLISPEWQANRQEEISENLFEGVCHFNLT
jgi:hypothetical protein